MRDEEFFSLAELNEAIRERLETFNARQFQKKECSRRDIFESEERPLLKPLPATPSEVAEWKTPTVQFNYHIESNVKKQQEHRSQVCNTFGLAKLIFKSDPVIIGQLEKIMKRFLELSSRELKVILAQREVFMKAFEQVRAAFADKGVATLQDVWLNQEALDMLNKLANTQDVIELERDIEAFWNNELSDEHFDKYFEPYISKIPKNALG